MSYIGKKCFVNWRFRSFVQYIFNKTRALMYDPLYLLVLIWKPLMRTNMNLDQIAPFGAVRPGFLLFASIVKGLLTVWALYAYFSDSQTLLLSFWCGAFSISAISESIGKSQQAKYFRNSYPLESYWW